MRTRTAALCASLLLSISPAAHAAADLDGWARVIAEHPDDPSGYESYALGAMADRRWDEAINQLRAGLARARSFPRGNYLLAIALRQRGDLAESARYYRLCIQLGQQVNDARYGLGKVLAALGQKQEAIAALREYIASETDPAKTRFVAAARGELASLEGHDTALQHDSSPPAPKTALSENERGTALFTAHQFPEAMEAFQSATALDPKYAVAWFNLANAYRKAGRTREAVEASERFVALAPDDPDGFYALGLARQNAGDTRGALQAYNRYLEIERRPERAKLVEKARVAVASLSADQRTGPPGPDDLSRDDILPFDASGTPRRLGDLRDPFEAQPVDRDDLLNPFTLGRANGDLGQGTTTIDPFPPGNSQMTIDPFAGTKGEKSHAATVRQEALAHAREYAQAVSAYRKALAAHSERVALRYEKGVSLILAGRAREATAAWDTIATDDEALVAARKSLERMRKGK